MKLRAIFLTISKKGFMAKIKTTFNPNMKEHTENAANNPQSEKDAFVFTNTWAEKNLSKDKFDQLSLRVPKTLSSRLSKYICHLNDQRGDNDRKVSIVHLVNWILDSHLKQNNF